MDPFHERLARVGLAALAEYGFALAGGYAVQAHGILDRPSEDIDLFTTLASEARFAEAVRVAAAAFAADGLSVEVLVENPGFARLLVIDASGGRSSKVELGIDWRQYPPTTLDIGPSSPEMMPLRTRSTPCTPAARPATTLTLMPLSPRVPHPALSTRQQMVDLGDRIATMHA